MTRYRLLMAVGGLLLLFGFVVRILADDGSNSVTRLMAASAVGAFAEFSPRIDWVARNHHLVALLCLLPFTYHMSMMTFTSNLSYDMAISNLVVLIMVCTVVENGEEAVDRVKSQAFDAVLMDLQMPQMDGLNAMRNIRALKNIKQPKIIPLTADAMQEDPDRCTAAGMNDFLSKPIRLKDLRLAIASNLAYMSACSP